MTTEFEHFARAPIVEALLDVRTTAAEAPDMHTLASFQEKVGRDYPAREIRAAWTSEVEFRPGNEPPVAKSLGGPVGYLFRSADGKQVVQARQDGFSFSRLRPYTDWPSVRDEARSLWTEYSRLVNPEKVTRIALRYINRFELPLPVDLKDYLLTAPDVAPSLPQHISSFFYRVVLPDEETKSIAIVTQTVQQGGKTEGMIPVIFDIDVFRVGALPTRTDKLWPMFEDLRFFKNRVFFESTTERAKELFR